MRDYGHWDTTTFGEFDPADFFGFIYEIEELSTTKCYIGKKFFRFKRKKTKSDPSRTKESDWRDYTSSCEPLVQLIEQIGKDKFAFRILSLCSGRCQLTYEEQQTQFTRDVLRARLPSGERKYFNKTIGHLLFAGVEKQSEESNEKVSRALMGRPKAPFSQEHRDNMADARRGKKATPEARANMAAAQLVRTPEHTAKIIAALRTPEIRKKIRDTSKGRPVSPETRAKTSARSKGNKYGVGHVVTPEHRARISAAKTIYWQHKKENESCQNQLSKSGSTLENLIQVWAPQG